MARTQRRPGEIRQAIVKFLTQHDGDTSIAEIYAALEEEFDGAVAHSSIRSELNFGVDNLYERTGRGRYRLRL